MYRKVENKEVMQSVPVYTWVARDGKEFDNPSDCGIYEVSLDEQWDKDKKYIDSLVVESLENLPRLNTDPDDDSWYRYFNIKTLSDLEKLRNVYDINERHLQDPMEFPTVIICQNASCYRFEDIESFRDVEHIDCDLIWYNLEEIIDETINFFDQLGYNVTFEKNK